MKESTIIRKVAMGELPATAIDLVAAVMKHVTCGCETGELLDVKTSVYVKTSLGGQYVFTGPCWDGISERFNVIMSNRGRTFEVIDGRTMKWGK